MEPAIPHTQALQHEIVDDFDWYNPPKEFANGKSACVISMAFSFRKRGDETAVIKVKVIDLDNDTCERSFPMGNQTIAKIVGKLVIGQQQAIFPAI